MTNMLMTIPKCKCGKYMKREGVFLNGVFQPIFVCRNHRIPEIYTYQDVKT